VNHTKSYIISFCSCICFGVSNYFNSYIAVKFGVLSVQMFFPGLMGMWITYHTYGRILACKDGKSYFATSNYRDEHGNIEKWKLGIPVTRMFI
jgi:hypothetical protein